MIDKVSYNKAAKHPPRWGYQARGGSAPSSVIIHTTNNRNKNTAFAGEARYLLDSSAVSAHYLISKTGQIIQFLDPLPWQAWHAGDCLPAFSNAKSIGIEHHVSVGEAWSPAQHEACTWLVRRLMAAFAIPPAQVDTHRAVALPKRRKSDPEGWEDEAFYRWRAMLAMPPPQLPYPMPGDWRHVRGLPVYERQDRTGPVARYLTPADTVEIDKTYPDGGVHLADGSGFADSNGLEPV